MEKPGRSLDDGQGQGSDEPRVTGRPRTQALSLSTSRVHRGWGDDGSDRGDEGILATHAGTAQGIQGIQGIPGPTRSPQGTQDHSGPTSAPEFKGP